MFETLDLQFQVLGVLFVMVRLQVPFMNPVCSCMTSEEGSECRTVPISNVLRIVQLEEASVDDLMDLVKQIVPFHVKVSTKDHC